MGQCNVGFSALERGLPGRSIKDNAEVAVVLGSSPGLDQRIHPLVTTFKLPAYSFSAD